MADEATLAKLKQFQDELFGPGNNPTHEDLLIALSNAHERLKGATGFDMTPGSDGGKYEMSTRGNDIGLPPAKPRPSPSPAPEQRKRERTIGHPVKTY